MESEAEAQVMVGDAHDILPDLAGGWFSWIVTDPPYGPDALDCYDLLGREAPRLLVKGGFLVVYAGKMYLDQVFARLGNDGLSWFWLLSERNQRNWPRVFSRRMLQLNKPILVFTKGRPKRLAWMRDEIEAPLAKDHHPWEQALDLPLFLFQKLARPGETVLDPFCGSGTTLVAAKMSGLNAVGVDNDPQAVATARQRLADIRPCPALAAGCRRTKRHWIGRRARPMHFGKKRKRRVHV